MPESDPVENLVHDHADLNRRVIAIGVLVEKVRRTSVDLAELVVPLTELRELLFLHFAREEEGLFPFVAEVLPSLADQMREMARAYSVHAECSARSCFLPSAVSR